MDEVSSPRTVSRASFAAFFLAAFSCLLGLCFCLAKGPEAQSEAYIGAAVEAMALNRGEDAAAAALAAVRLDPSNSQNWQILSKMLQSTGRHDAALEAQKIVARMQHGPMQSSPVYAMPAEFRLSLMAGPQSLSP